MLGASAFRRHLDEIGQCTVAAAGVKSRQE
jgi:hypothetical protein